MAWPAMALLPGWVLGIALQLQQTALWSAGAYVALLAMACLSAMAALLCRIGPWSALCLALAAGASAGAGLTGLRAAHHASQALAPALEGVDITLTGRVAALPQRGADGVRFDWVVETATHAGQAVQLPPRLQLAWHTRGAAGDSPAWRAGDRWRVVARLRRPHGSFNPHGFDRERWLWENGIGATGYVRNGPRDAPPVFLGASAWHPVESARQWVSERIRQRVPEPHSAGVLAGLVVGDQSAIDSGDKQ
jgi:competence protein ComEC